MKHFGLLFLLITCVVSAQELTSSIEPVLEYGMIDTNEKHDFAPDFKVSSNPSNGAVRIFELHNNWENIILRSINGQTIELIPNDSEPSPKEVNVDFSREKSGTYFCEVEYRDKKKNVKSFRLP